jgi:hypothetical protein
VSNHFTHRLLNMERSQWVCGFFSPFHKFHHSIISIPDRYISFNIHHVNIHSRVIVGRREGSLTAPCFTRGCSSISHFFPLWKMVHHHNRMFLHQ